MKVELDMSLEQMDLLDNVLLECISEAGMKGDETEHLQSLQNELDRAFNQATGVNVKGV